MEQLLGLTWNHPRGLDPLVAVSAEYVQKGYGAGVHWDTQPLSAFEDRPLRERAAGYDLIALDHPFIGDAIHEATLTPLDDLLGPELLDDLTTDSPGPTQASYRMHGRQWAVGVDAACMVSALREDHAPELGAVRTWEDAFAAAAELGPERVLIAANPTHLYGTFLSLCESVAGDGIRPSPFEPTWWSAAGLDPAVSRAAIQQLTRLLAYCGDDSWHTDPIAALDRLAEPGGEVAYVPLVFQYVTYSRDNAAVTFAPAPSATRDRSAGTLTGGVGLAVSAGSEKLESAASFLRFVTRREIQSGTFAAAGGQPARLSAWQDAALNTSSNGFFERTLPTLSASFLRPRFRGYPLFQSLASELMHTVLKGGGDAEALVVALNRLWRRTVHAE